LVLVFLKLVFEFDIEDFLVFADRLYVVEDKEDLPAEATAYEIGANRALKVDQIAFPRFAELVELFQ
jgi:hypothetical protein